MYLRDSASAPCFSESRVRKVPRGQRVAWSGQTFGSHVQLAESVEIQHWGQEMRFIEGWRQKMRRAK